MISSRSPGLRSQRAFSTVRSESLSSVSSSRSTESGLPVRFGRAFFLDDGGTGSRAFERAGDVVISSSRSGEGEAFRFLEGLAEDTANVDVSVIKMTGYGKKLTRSTGRESSVLVEMGRDRRGCQAIHNDCVRRRLIWYLFAVEGAV